MFVWTQRLFSLSNPRKRVATRREKIIIFHLPALWHFALSDKYEEGRTQVQKCPGGEGGGERETELKWVEHVEGLAIVRHL